MKRTLLIVSMIALLIMSSLSLSQAQSITNSTGRILNVGYGLGGVPLITVALTTPNTNTYTFVIPQNQTYTNGLIAMALAAVSSNIPVTLKTVGLTSGSVIASMTVQP